MAERLRKAIPKVPKAMFEKFLSELEKDPAQLILPLHLGLFYPTTKASWSR
jgi:hypothetical protein